MEDGPTKLLGGRVGGGGVCERKKENDISTLTNLSPEKYEESRKQWGNNTENLKWVLDKFHCISVEHLLLMV